MKLYKLFVLATLCMAPHVLKAQTEYDCSKDFLVWKDGHKLTWECYKAEVDTKLRSDFESVTYVSFLPIGKAEEAKVVCVFDAKASWTTSGSLSLLAHQQLHFDLGEFYARRIRRDLQKLLAEGKLTEKTQLKAIEDNYQLYSEHFLQYSQETVQGIDVFQQQAWANRIKDLLNELSAYKLD